MKDTGNPVTNVEEAFRSLARNFIAVKGHITPRQIPNEQVLEFTFSLPLGNQDYNSQIEKLHDRFKWWVRDNDPDYPIFSATLNGNPNIPNDLSVSLRVNKNALDEVANYLNTMDDGTKTDQFKEYLEHRIHKLLAANIPPERILAATTMMKDEWEKVIASGIRPQPVEVPEELASGDVTHKLGSEALLEHFKRSTNAKVNALVRVFHDLSNSAASKPTDPLSDINYLLKEMIVQSHSTGTSVAQQWSRYMEKKLGKDPEPDIGDDIMPQRKR